MTAYLTAEAMVAQTAEWMDDWLAEKTVEQLVGMWVVWRVELKVEQKVRKMAVLLDERLVGKSVCV